MSARPLDVCIVNYGDPQVLDGCLTAVRRHLPDEQVRVWDNRSDSSDEVRRLADRYPEVDWTFSPCGLGFAAGANRLVARSDRDTLLLNPDAALSGSLTRTRAALGGDGVAAVSPTVVDPSGQAQRWDVAHRRQTVTRVLVNYAGYAPQLRGTPFSDLYPAPPRTVSGYITGCCLLVARAAWDDVGPLDERFFLYGEDPDWQRRALRRGWRLLLVDEPHTSHGKAPGAARPARRSQDLRLANTAIMMGFRGGLGRGALVLGGDLVLERVQRSKRRDRANGLVHDGASARGHHVLLTTPTLEAADEPRRRVALANEIARRGHPVTLVCTEALGPVQRELDPAVRLLLRPWWLPMVDVVGAEAVMICGRTRSELAFAAGWAYRPGRRPRRRWLVEVPEAGGQRDLHPALAAVVARSHGVVTAPDACDPAAMADEYGAAMSAVLR